MARSSTVMPVRPVTDCVAAAKVRPHSLLTPGQEISPRGSSSWVTALSTSSIPLPSGFQEVRCPRGKIFCLKRTYGLWSLMSNRSRAHAAEQPGSRMRELQSLLVRADTPDKERQNSRALGPATSYTRTMTEPAQAQAPEPRSTSTTRADEPFATWQTAHALLLSGREIENNHRPRNPLHRRG